MKFQFGSQNYIVKPTTCMDLIMFLFIYGPLNDEVSRPDYIALDYRTTDEFERTWKKQPWLNLKYYMNLEIS